MATFLNLEPFNYTRPIVLWIIFYLMNGSLLIIYVLSQIFLVVRTLDDRWPLGTIASGVICYITGLFVMYGFSIQICEGTKHYVDGLFFGTMTNLLSVMAVYKYWDSITKEDLEFSIDTKYQTWEIDGLLS